MPPLTAKNIYRHELIGLDVIVESLHHPEYSKIKGTIVNETKNMITISDGMHDRRIIKKLAKFDVILPNNRPIMLDGRKIIGRPEDRIKLRRR